MNKDQLTVVPPQMDKNTSLQFWSDDYSKVNHLREELSLFLCKRGSSSKSYNYFWQGNSKEWFMIEFWTGSQSELLEFCTILAEAVGEQLYV